MAFGSRERPLMIGSEQRIEQSRYAVGFDTYIEVVTLQATALTYERNDINLMWRRLETNVLLIKAVGGG